ncbi:MAG: hypothetical protein K6E27_00930 [Eubacterium sp.]|nr:hypothetical protein [Eubacterium sp.]
MSISLSSAMIYFGCVCLLISIMIFVAQHKTNKKVGTNKALNDRIILYKNKWQKEHVNLMLLATGVVVGLVLLGVFTDLTAFIYLSGVAFLGLYIYIYNKMMIYVEAFAFNGKGQEEN